MSFNSKDDVLQPVHSFFHCSFQLAYPKVFFSHVTFNNPRLALNVLALEHDEARLRQKLDRAEKIIEAQKKLCDLLGLPKAEEA